MIVKRYNQFYRPAYVEIRLELARRLRRRGESIKSIINKALERYLQEAENNTHGGKDTP